MKRLFALASVLLSTVLFAGGERCRATCGESTAREGADAAPVRIPPNWKEGDKYRIECVREISEARGKKVQKGKTTTTIDVEVDARGKDNFVLSWTYGETHVAGEEEGKVSRAAHDAANVQTGLHMTMETDETGVPQKIVNEKEILEFWKKFKESARSREKASKEAERIAESMLGSEVAVQAFLEDPRAFYFLCGSELVEGKMVEYEDSLANPLGGTDPFPCKGRTLLKKVDRAKEEALLEWSLIVDPERALGIIRKEIERFAKGAGKPAPKLPDRPLKIEHHATYVLDLRTGLPRKVSRVSRTVFGELDRAITTEFRVVSATR